MNGNTLLLALVGLGVILAVLLLFPAGEPVVNSPSVLPGETSGTSSQQVHGASVAQYPIVEAGEDRTVGEREAVRLSGIGYDPSGAAVAVRWTAEPGLGFFSDPSALDALYTAPSACDCEDCVTLTLTVTSTRTGLSASDRLTLFVRDPLACPTERAACTTGGEATRVCADPCAVAPADACPPKPDVPCEGPCVTQAPSAGDCLEVPVPCRCAEGCGPAWDAAWPLTSDPILARDRPKPMIDRQFLTHVAEGSAVRLRGAILNPACTSVCFVWSVNKGWLEEANTLEPIYHAPPSDRRGGETVTVTLTAYDAAERSSYDQIRFHIDNVNGPGSAP